MYEGFATKEMLQKRWRKDAEYEVGYFKPISSVGSTPRPISLDCLPDGCLQDPYTRCKGLNEIAPQVNGHCPPVGAPLLTRIVVVFTGKRLVDLIIGLCARCSWLSSPVLPFQPRMYTKLAVTGRRVLSSTEHPNRLILWQKYEHTIRVAGTKKVRLLRPLS